MNNDNGSIDFEARLRLEKLEEGVKEMEKMLNDSMKSSQKETDKLQQSINNLAKGAMAFFTISKAYEFTQKIIAVRSQFQQLEIAFGTMLKSKEKANALMAQMTDLAAKTPFGLQEVSEGAKRLLAFQVPAQEVTETLRRMGDVAAGLGVPMGQLIHVYGQVKAQGKLMTNDLYQFMNAGIPIIAELSKVVGKSETEIKDMVSAGKIGFAEVQAVIKGMTDEGGLFYNLMAEQSKTLSGQLSNLEDNFANVLNEIGKSTEGIASGAISSVSFLVENYQTLGKVIAGLIATYGAYRTAVLVNIALTKGWAVAAKEDAIAKGIQTIATNAATAATKALNAAMKANPYVLVATAVVGLGAAIWALKDNTTAAEKAQLDYNNQKQQAIDWEQQHKQKIDDLIESATNQALADTERQKALIALQNEYPNIFAKYDIESLKLADILKLKQEIAQYDANEKRLNRANEYGKYQDFEKALNKAKTGKRAYDANKLKNSILDEEMTRVFGKSWIHNIDEVEKYIREKQKITKNDYKGDRVAAWSMEVKNLSEDEIKKELEHRQKLIADLQKQKKAGNKWASHGVNFGGDWFAFNEEELQAQSKTLQVQLDKLHEQTYEYKDLTKKYTQAVKDAEVALDTIKNGGKGKHTEEEFAKIIKEAEDNLKNAKKTLEDHKTSLSKSKGAKAAKTKTELPTFDYKKAAQEEARREQDFLFQKEQARINIMEDGARKRLAIIQLDYDRQEEEIRRRTEDQMAAFIEQQKAQAEAEGKWKKGQSFNENTPEINAHKAKLQTEEQQLLASNHDYMLYQQEQVYKQLLEKYQTYTDQRKAIEEKYNADIAALQAKLGADAPQVKKAQDEKARELKKLDILYKKEGTAIAKLFENMRKKTVKEIRQTIADAEKEIDQLASTLDMSDKDNVEFIQNLKQQLEQARDTADRSDTVFGKLGTSIKNLFKAKPNTAEWQEAFNGMLSSAQSITSEFGQLGQEFEKLGQSTGNESLKRIGESVKEAGSIINKTLSFAQTGSAAGPWGAAIGAVVGAVYGIYEKVESDKERARQRERQWKEEQIQFEKKLNDLYDERILKGQKFMNAFTENKIGKQIDVINNYKNKIKGLRENLINIQNSQVFSHYDKKWVTDKAFGFIPLGAHQESIARTKAFKDKYQKLVDDFGNIDFEFLERLNENDFGAYATRIGLGTAEIDEGLKRVISDAKEVNNKLKEYREEIDKYTKETFGPLGANFSDSIISAVEKGESAFENFGQTVSRVMKNVIKQTLVTQNIKKLFDDFDKAVGDIYTRGIGLSNEQLYENVKNKTIEFVNNTLKPEIQKGEQKAKAMFDALEQSGIKMYDDRGIGRQAVEKGFARMSQDTGDDLLGQFRLQTQLSTEMKNAMLQSVKEFTEMHKFMQISFAQQLKHLAGIEANTYKLHKIETDIANMKAGISEITTKGIKIRS